MAAASESQGPAPHVVAVVGPTGAGKAALGRQLAKRFELPLLVCDSVKVYRGLDIGSAKPTAEHRAEVRHELLDLVDPDELFSAGDYARLAWPHVAGGRGLVVGGTGFYLRALGWTHSTGVAGIERPPDDPQRVAFEQTWQERERAESGAMARALSAIDPETATTIHPNNLVRLLRALWLCHCTGGPISDARRADPPRMRIRLLLVVVEPPPAILDARIERRLDRMLDAGWLHEVEKLREAGYDARNKAMRSLGYRQLLDVVEGRSTLAEAREAILIATRQYARRQRTFIRTQLPATSTLTLQTPEPCPWDTIEGFFQETTA